LFGGAGDGTVFSTAREATVSSIASAEDKPSAVVAVCLQLEVQVPIFQYRAVPTRHNIAFFQSANIFRRTHPFSKKISEPGP